MLNKLIGIKIAILFGLLSGCGGHPPVITEGPVRTTSAICSFPVEQDVNQPWSSSWGFDWIKENEETIIVSKDIQGHKQFQFAFNVVTKNKIDINFKKITLETNWSGKKLYNFNFEGKKVDLSYTRLVGWPFPTKFKKIELEGITGEMVISKYEKGIEVPMARVSLNKTYIPDFKLNRFFQSPHGKYLIFVSKADHANPIAYVFKLEEQ